MNHDLNLLIDISAVDLWCFFPGSMQDLYLFDFPSVRVDPQNRHGNRPDKPSWATASGIHQQRPMFSDRINPESAVSLQRQIRLQIPENDLVSLGGHVYTVN